MNKSILLFCLTLLIGNLFIYGQLVTTNSELNTAISNATAGTTITLKDQIWTNVQININKTGTADNPITIQAETFGSVFLEGNSYVKMGGEYIVFKGVVFQNPSNLSTGTPTIDFRASSTECNNCTVTNIKIVSYNGTVSQEEDVYKWILLRGQYNEVSYSSFIGKHGVGSIINDNRSSGVANYHKIHHNYFAERTPVGEVNALNDQDAIRIGSSSTSLSDSFTEIYHNYFYDFSGEIEVISNKSGKNKYYNNTFEDYQGSLTLRHGNDCEVYDNFFFANNNSFTGGVRVIGEGHKIYNNYIEGINSRKANNSLSNGTGGINVSNGKPNSALNEYYQVKNVTIVNNTFVDCDYGLRIGTKINSSLTLEPENLIVANNIFYENTDSALQIVSAPSGASSKFEGNIKQNGSWDIPTGTDGNINVTSGLLTSGSDFYRISSGSAAINSGLGSYPFLNTDIIGGTRPASFDVGAEEFGSGGTKLPYSQADVGVTVGFGASETLSNEDYNLDEKLRIYPNPIIGDYMNLSLKNEIIGLVKIIDLLGRTVHQKNITSTNVQIDISNISKGMYIVKVNNRSKKILIQ